MDRDEEIRDFFWDYDRRIVDENLSKEQEERAEELYLQSLNEVQKKEYFQLVYG